MPNRKRAVLAIDLGTSAVKVLLVGASGDVLAASSATYPTVHPRSYHDEQSPSEWLTGIAAAVGACRSTLDACDLAAVAITGQMHGTVCFDSSNRVLGNAIIWSDRRAAGVVERLPRTLASRATMLTGGPVSTGTLATTLAWCREHDQARWRDIARVALPVDALGFLLTGVFATDPSNAVGSGLYALTSGTWDQPILDALGIPAEWFPPVVATGSIIGSVTLKIAKSLGLPAGTPVIHAGGDAASAAIGGDVLTETDAMITLSTGAQVVMPTHDGTAHLEGRWHTWPAAIPDTADGCRWLRIGALLNAGRAIDWLHHTLAPSQPLEAMLDLASAIDPGADGLLFVPSLAGERQPQLDPRARGGFLGLAEHHTARHLARAVLEGIALSLAEMASEMDDDISRRRVTISGGPARSAVVRQVVSDCLGVPLHRHEDQTGSAYGAARIATHVLGWRPIEPRTAAGSEVTKPAHDAMERYRSLLPIFRDARAAIAPISHRLASR